MIISSGAFYSIFPVLYSLLLGIWYFVLFPKPKVSDQDVSKIMLVSACSAIFFICLYWLSRIFRQTVLLETLFPSVIIKSLLSWIALLAGTAWIFVSTTVLHGLILSFIFSIGIFETMSWIVSANFISYLIALSIMLFIL